MKYTNILNAIDKIEHKWCLIVYKQTIPAKDQYEDMQISHTIQRIVRIDCGPGFLRRKLDQNEQKNRVVVCNTLHYKAPRVLGYYINGIEVSKEEAMAYARPPTWKSKTNDLYCLDIAINNIIRLGK